MKRFIIAAFFLLASTASAAEIQNYTSYEAVLMTGATTAEAARAVLRHLATTAAKAAFTASGVE